MTMVTVIVVQLAHVSAVGSSSASELDVAQATDIRANRPVTAAHMVPTMLVPILTIFVTQ